MSDIKYVKIDLFDTGNAVTIEMKQKYRFSVEKNVKE